MFKNKKNDQIAKRLGLKWIEEYNTYWIADESDHEHRGIIQSMQETNRSLQNRIRAIEDYLKITIESTPKQIKYVKAKKPKKGQSNTGCDYDSGYLVTYPF